jgi:hypothetical protein
MITISASHEERISDNQGRPGDGGNMACSTHTRHPNHHLVFTPLCAAAARPPLEMHLLPPPSWHRCARQPYHQPQARRAQGRSACTWFDSMTGGTVPTVRPKRYPVSSPHLTPIRSKIRGGTTQHSIVCAADEAGDPARRVPPGAGRWLLPSYTARGVPAPNTREPSHDRICGLRICYLPYLNSLIEHRWGALRTYLGKPRAGIVIQPALQWPR